MRVTLSDEQDFLREAVAGVVAREAPFGAVREWTEAGDASPADELARRQGWPGIGLAEEAGGQGGGAIELAVLGEQLGYGAVPWDRTMAGCLALPLLAAAGDAGREVAAASAEDAGTILVLDGRALVGSALGGAAFTLDGDLLSLEARHVPGAAGAARLVVPVSAGEEIELRGVDPGDATVKITPLTLVDRTRSLAAVTLDRAPSTVLGTVGVSAFSATASLAAVVLAADALGAAARLLELTVEYVAERRQFGVPVGAFQAVKHAAAQMLVDVEACRSAVSYAAWAVDDGAEDAAIAAAIAKSHTADAASRVADRALFLHGAIGYTWEHDLQFLFKRIKSDAVLFGGATAHRDRIAVALGI
jgi:alkylation response protein AidB-like acyl-CoA dehydrogenase